MRPVKDARVAKANAIDIYAGSRIRERRKAIKVSQTELAEKLGLTFQQIQKYERGSNRVSASKLYEIALALTVPVTFFFDGYGDKPATGGDPATDIHAFLHTSKALDLGEAFLSLANNQQRDAVIVLMRSLGKAK